MSAKTYHYVPLRSANLSPNGPVPHLMSGESALWRISAKRLPSFILCCSRFGLASSAAPSQKLLAPLRPRRIPTPGLPPGFPGIDVSLNGQSLIEVMIWIPVFMILFLGLAAGFRKERTALERRYRNFAITSPSVNSWFEEE